MLRIRFIPAQLLTLYLKDPFKGLCKALKRRTPWYLIGRGPQNLLLLEAVALQEPDRIEVPRPVKPAFGDAAGISFDWISCTIPIIGGILVRFLRATAKLRLQFSMSFFVLGCLQLL